jgi:DNA repair photolyase
MALKTTRGDSGGPAKGRGAASNLEGRFEQWQRASVDDGWAREDVDLPPIRTEVVREQAKSIIARNNSPDVGFDQSINPYRGCEHGCVYCYARPTHAYLGLSPGLDFETRLYAKVNAAELLRQELAAPRYECKLIALGANTDPYQPVERELRITRQVIEVLAECEHPVGIVTKSSLVERDVDLIAPMAAKNLARVHISVTNLDPALARKLEPRAAAPYRRIETVRRLSEAGIPVGVLVAPIIPFLNDRNIEEILERVKEAGAVEAGYVLLRLPYEIAPLFKEWLATHYPLKAAHIMSLVHQMREGKDYDPTFGVRQRGTGTFAELIAKRFQIACERLGLHGRYTLPLDHTRFKPPGRSGQMALF